MLSVKIVSPKDKRQLLPAIMPSLKNRIKSTESKKQELKLIIKTGYDYEKRELYTSYK